MQKIYCLKNKIKTIQKKLSSGKIPFENVCIQEYE